MHGSHPRFGLAGAVSTKDGHSEVDCNGWMKSDDAHNGAHNLAKRFGVTVSIVVDGVRATFEPDPS